MNAPDASVGLTLGFAGYALCVAAGFVWLVQRADRGAGPASSHARRTIIVGVGTALWLAATFIAASSGLVARTDLRPPPMMFVLLAVVTSSVALALGPIGTRLVHGLPLWMLVLSQAFRLPLEMLMHQAALEGVMPIQMSYEGWNFDILTGASAVPVAWLLARGRGGRRLATGWNIVGCLLLANIVTIAVLSLPMFARFGANRPNTWVAYPPFIWLPTVMVVGALTAHLVIARKLRIHSRD